MSSPDPPTYPIGQRVKSTICSLLWQPSELSTDGKRKSTLSVCGESVDSAETITAQQPTAPPTPKNDSSLHVWLKRTCIAALRRLQAVRFVPQDHLQHPSWLNGIFILQLHIAAHQLRLTHLFWKALHAYLPAWVNNLWILFHTHNMPFFLTSLGAQLHGRFERTGDLADLVEAISLHRQALQLTPEGHAALSISLGNIANSLQARFHSTRDLAYLDEAILSGQRAIQLAPEGYAFLPAWLCNLGNSLTHRFERTGDLTDIEEAISAHQRAVQLTPKGDPFLAVWLDDLGTSLQSRFAHTGNVVDIDEAISVGQRAVHLIPEGHARLPSCLNNLGISLECRFGCIKDLADVDQCISVKQKAVELTPAGHASLPNRLTSLGKSLYARSLETDNSEDLDASISHFKSAATSSFGSPQARLAASKQWARVLNLRKEGSADLLTAFDTAIQLLALVAGLEQTVQGRYAQLQGAADIALEGAASACRLQRPDKAVEWLEQGCCLVWNQLNSLRTPLDDLRMQDNQLAQRFADVSKLLEWASASQSNFDHSIRMGANTAAQDEESSHLALARTWNNLLSAVRGRPGFESFLQASTCSNLMRHLPPSGTVVIINVHKDGCAAIALVSGRDAHVHIPLTTFSLAKANKYRDDLSAQLQSGDIRMRGAGADTDSRVLGRAVVQGWRKPADRVVHKILRGLWNEVAKPILGALEYSKFDVSSGGAMPRIWWCPTGVMSFLPLHAAGIYDSNTSESLLDYAVSSYTPTITALTDRVKNGRPIDKTVSGLFLTSQPKATGMPVIAGTVTEVDKIYDMAAGRGVRALKIGSDLTGQGCLKHIQDYSSVHLACHASQNAKDPLQSRFILHSGMLALGTIIQMNMRNADLAFLSACHTSTGQAQLSDEAVHLAAGMLAAGYRRVVATMWSIKDQYAPEVAKDFYEYLWSRREDGSGDGFDGTLSAYALHHAVQQLRERLGNSEDALLTWVPYVHFGY